MAHLKLLGGALLEDDSGRSMELASRRHPLALLARLATAPSRTLSRGKLAGLLWPRASEGKTRDRLNTCVHRIRKDLGHDVLVSVGSDLRLETDTGALICDVCRFEEALDAGELRAAVEAYDGPFLDGFDLGESPAFERWMDRERDRLRRAYHGALETLAIEAEQRDDFGSAADWWGARVRDDPYDSRAVRRLMQVLAAAGNRAAALRAADVHARLTQEELGLPPDASVAELAERLRVSSDREEGGLATAATSPESERRATTPDPDAGPGKDVDRAPPPVQKPPPTDPDRRPTFRPDRARTRQLLVALGLVGVVAAGVWLLVGGGIANEPSPLDRSVAVLPFESLGDRSDDDFAAGLHADLVTRLTAVSDLRVVSRRAAARYGDSEEPLPAVARQLNVGWIMEGEVQRVGDSVQVNAQLVDARTGVHAWARSYRRGLDRLFDIQEDITRDIVRALEVELTSDEERRVSTAPTDSAAAYELYLLASAPLPRRTDRRPNETIDHRVRLYRRALELDSTFAEAWAGLAEMYVHRGWRPEYPPTWADSARAAAGRALELDSTLASAHAVIGDSYWPRAAGDRRQIEAYRKALELNPSDVQVAGNLIAILEQRGRLAEGMRWRDQLYRTSPEAGPEWLILPNAALGRDDVVERWLELARERGHDVTQQELLLELLYRVRLDRARALVAAMEERELGRFVTRRRAALTLYEGRWREARRLYRRLYPRVPGSRHPVFQGLLSEGLGLAWSLDRLGEAEDAELIAREVVETAREELETGSLSVAPRHRMAVARLVAGDTATALTWLERAVEVGDRSVRILRRVPTVAPLRDHPRFRSLLSRLDSLVVEERRRVEAEGWGLP